MSSEMNDEAEVYKLWHIRKTLFEMSHDRGYLVTSAELDQTVEQFTELFGDKPSEQRPMRSDLTMLLSHADDPKNRMLVFFPEEPKVAVKTIKAYAHRMEGEGIHRAILVVRDCLTPPAKQSIMAMAPLYIMEQFLESELTINVTKHELVPQHVVLSDVEKKQLFRCYRLKESQMMRMLSSDPVARYYGLKPGQVVKIVRASESAGKYISYRIVC
ncbi:DNA-directed RNA polymerases I, II, and III subunit RPABC1-like [Drosophila pseudoobscura]|uniref:DNA-directed RNA polymerases I, II, and III subunit RPABC1 n=1 Tax=Drosophila pseudoobscura pseudoobscura TaxID=46245 RepID=A0A6I8UZ36_DROPS|nr:DNA-directed RNA polymerases I, II, and III subunit RPABC1 [Drosophila pseudoobscura]